ncbi:hypothetical protein [Tsukamurella serpentis]
MIALVALGGACGAVFGYRLIAAGGRGTALLITTLVVSLLLGGVARMVRILGDLGVAALPIAVLGPAVTFVGLGWWVLRAPRRALPRALVMVSGGVVAAMLGYLSIDLLGLAYIKFPRIG